MLTSNIHNVNTFFNPSFLTVTCGFLLSSEKKTIPVIAKNLVKSASSVYRILEQQKIHVELASEQFFKYIKSISHEGHFVIDDTVINKQFSKEIEGTSEVFDTIAHRAYTGFSLITLSWTDGKRTILIAYALWYNKDVAQDTYKTKVELAKQLIKDIPASLTYKGILFDGLYATKDMINFLIDRNIRFVARAATNRVVTHKDSKLPLKNHPSLKLRKHEHSRTVKAQWGDLSLYFTKEKRKDRHGVISYVFLVSNFKTSSKNYVYIYSSRWGIEVFHRTAKQSLGLKDCQSTSIKMQKVRINAVFYMYAFLYHQKELLKASCIEDVIRYVQSLKYEELMSNLIAFNQIFHQNGLSPDTSTLQRHSCSPCP